MNTQRVVSMYEDRNHKTLSLRMECGHFIVRTHLDLMSMNGRMPRVGDVLICLECADPTPQATGEWPPAWLGW